MLVAPLVAALVLAHTSPPAWRSVSVTRSADGVRATLRYEVRGPATYPLLRGVHLTVTRRGRTAVAATLHGFAWGTLSLQLQDVWGDTEPEALVTNAECGNRCAYVLFVAVPRTGRVLEAYLGIQFEPPRGWRGERHDGRFEFVMNDGRFFCIFSDCASSAMPVRVLAVDPSGTRFSDVSRSRADLLTADAAQLWRGYLTQRAAPYQNWLGTFAPWCADEYRLDRNRAFCDRRLPHKVRAQMAAWGYR